MKGFQFGSFLRANKICSQHMPFSYVNQFQRYWVVLGWYEIGDGTPCRRQTVP